MVPKQRTARGGVLLGLLILVVTGRADEATSVKEMLGRWLMVTVDVGRPGKPVVGLDLSRARITDGELKNLGVG